MKLSVCLLAFAVLLGSATAIRPQGRALLQDTDNDDDNDNSNCRSPLQTLALYPQTFSSLTAAVQAAGLTGYLDNTQNKIGVFAPTNRAFSRLATMMNTTVAQLAQNADLMRAVVLYHITADSDDINELAGDRTGTENTFLGPNLNITAVRTQNPQNVTQPASAAPAALTPPTAASAGRKLLQEEDGGGDDGGNDNDNDDDNNNNNNNNDNDNDDDNNNNNNNNDGNDNDDDNDNNEDRFEEGENSSRSRSLYLVSAAGSIARVTVANLNACEATVHVVDTVLIPPTPFLSSPVAVTQPDPNTFRVVSGPANAPICTSTVTRGPPQEDDDDLRVEDNCPNFA